MRSDADFMAGGQNAGRYFVCAARSEQGAEAASYVARCQAFLLAGFTPTWFDQIAVPVSLITLVFGFVIHRSRQTRAFTLGQFYEMRYSRNFRLFAGMLGFFAGLVNFGLIPVIGARFMVYFLGLCVLTTTMGGQVSVLLTVCAEGMISQLFYTLIAGVLPPPGRH